MVTAVRSCCISPFYLHIHYSSCLFVIRNVYAFNSDIIEEQYAANDDMRID